MYLADLAFDCVYPPVYKHARSGGILDVDKGPGSAGNELNAAACRVYTGWTCPNWQSQRQNENCKESSKR
jgi:hypothetical protein